MKIFFALLLLLPAVSLGQQTINCAPNTPCTTAGPLATGAGDQAGIAMGKVNANFAAIPSEFYSFLPLSIVHGGTGHSSAAAALNALLPTFIPGDCLGNDGSMALWVTCGTGGGGILGTLNGGTGAASLSAANLPVFTGAITPGDCVQWITSTSIGDSGTVGCAAGGGGSGTVNTGTAGQLAGYASSGTAVSGTSVGNGLVVNGTTLSANYLPRSNSATTDTIVAADCGYGVWETNAGNVAISIAAATGTLASCSVDIVAGGNGILTLTPSGSTVNGAASVSFPAGTNINLSSSSGNWLATGTGTIAGLNLPGLTSAHVVSGNPSAQNQVMYATTTMSGTASSSNTPPRWGLYHETNTSDSVVCASGLCGLHYFFDDLTSGWDGNHNLLNAYLQIDAPPVTPGSNAVGLNLLVNVNSQQGGIAGCWGCGQGQDWAFNPSLFTNGGKATNEHLWTTAEWDTTLSAGASANEKHMSTFVTGPNDAVRGSMDDSVLAFSTQDNTGTSTWKNIFECGNVAHACPLTTDSVIFNLPRRQLGGTTQVTFGSGFDLSWGAMTAGGFGFKNYGFETDSLGGVWGQTLNAGSGGVVSETAVVASIALVPYGGYTGGAYFDQASFPVLHLDASPGGGTQATASVSTMALTAAILNYSSASGGGAVAATDAGCLVGDVLTVSGVTGTAPQVTVGTVVSGKITAISITRAGSITATSGTITTTGGSCTTQPTIAFGFGIATMSLTNAGTLYPCNPVPNVWTTGPFTNTTNTPAAFLATMTCTAQPVNFPNGITLAGGPTLTTVASTLAQSSLPMTAPASGFVDANGNLIIGLNPPGTVFLSSSTAGSGITITCNTACFTGTAAGDTGRVFTFSDGGTGYKTFLVTGNSGASTTIAQGTLATTLITACAVGTPCAAAGIYETGTNTTTNTAASGTTYPAPLALGYPSGYYSLPATALGAAGIYYCTTSSATDLTVLACFNNKYATGTPAIPGSPTAFSGLTPAAYTQSTSSQALISSTVGAGTMSLNGCIDWNFSYQYDLSATSKTVSGKLGSAGIGIAATTFGDGTMQSRVCNAGAAGVQSLSATYTSPTATTLQTGAPSWSSVATGSAQTAVIQVTLAAATDTLTISNYSITERAN